MLWLSWHSFFFFLTLALTGSFGYKSESACDAGTGIPSAGIDFEIYCNGYGAAAAFFFFASLSSLAGAFFAFRGEKNYFLALFFSSWSLSSIGFISAYGALSESACGTTVNDDMIVGVNVSDLNTCPLI